MSEPRTLLKKTRIWLKKAYEATERFFYETNLIEFIRASFRHDLLASEKLLIGLMITAIVFFPLASAIVNTLGPRYDTPSVISWIGLFPGCLTVFFICLKIRKRYRYVGSVLTILFASMTCFLVMLAGANSILSTPFGGNDLSHTLLGLDNWLGFHQATLMNWRAHYPALTTWLDKAYYSITTQVAFTAVLLAVCQCFRAARLYILTIVIGTLLAYLIYYFWPTFAPAYVIHNALFPIDATHLIERTLNIRHYVPYQIYPTAGLIAFPSCHVLMGLTGIFAWFAAYKETKKHWLKPIMVIVSILSLIVNLSLIAATVLLGFHYLVDVLASLVIFAVSFFWLQSIIHKEAH